MGKTIMGAVVSLVGFMADDNDEVGPLFDWYGNGDVAWSFPGSDGESRSTQASADFMRSHYRNMATVVIGRRLFDMTNGWNGKPAAGNMSSSSPISRRRTGSMPAPHRSLSSMTLRRPSRLPRSFPATGMLTWRRVRSEARRSSSGSSTRWSSTRSRWSSARGGRSSPLVPGGAVAAGESDHDRARRPGHSPGVRRQPLTPAVMSGTRPEEQTPVTRCNESSPDVNLR
jgi:hypothetical protein